MTFSSPLLRTLIALGMSLIAIPVSRSISPRAIIDSHELYLAWLPLSVMIAMILLFGRYAVLPVLTTLTIVNYTEWHLSLTQNAILVMCQALPLILFCGVVRIFLGSRWRFGLPNKWMGVRILWLGFVTPLSVKLMMYCAGLYVAFPAEISPYFASDSMQYRIIDSLSLIAASMIFPLIFYYPLRMSLNPRYVRTLWRTCITPYITPKRRTFTLGWITVLILVLLLLCSTYESELVGGYLVPAIFVLVTIGIRRLGPRFIMVCWACSAYLLLTYNRSFLHGLSSEYSLAFVLSVFISFTICILYMTSIFMRSQWVKQRWHAQAMTDPLTQLPNLRALEHALRDNPSSNLGCLRMNNLEFLSRHYGMLMRMYCKRTVSQELKLWLNEGERVYQLPGSELLITLNGPDPEARLSHMLARLNSRKIDWHNTPVEIEFSAAWGVLRQNSADLQTMLGQLGYLAEQAAEANAVLSLNASQAVVSGQTSGRVFMLQKVKQALDEGSLLLYAQPVVDASGRGYREILTRLRCGEEVITPDKFIPVVAQFNLSARFDLLVMEKMLSWLQRHPAQEEGARFSINLMPLTLMRCDIGHHIIALFHRYGVAVSNVILEVTEEQAFSGSEVSIHNINVLREGGFKIAIDDFGTGYANYERLKRLQADIIKIDGCFINDILTDSMDAMIVKSICELAKVKSLSVVAEFVETAQQRELLLALGVDYLQGYLTGRPEPLSVEA